MLSDQCQALKRFTAVWNKKKCDMNEKTLYILNILNILNMLNKIL